VIRSYQIIRKRVIAEIKREKTDMNISNDAFELAASAAKSLPAKPDDQTLLKLYALYKQGSAGDVIGDKPGFFDFIGSAKFEAWEKLKGTSQEDARSQYVELVRKLGGKF